MLWMSINNIILREWSQKLKIKCCVILLFVHPENMFSLETKIILVIVISLEQSSVKSQCVWNQKNIVFSPVTCSETDTKIAMNHKNSTVIRLYTLYSLSIGKMSATNLKNTNFESRVKEFMLVLYIIGT